MANAINFEIRGTRPKHAVSVGDGFVVIRRRPDAPRLK